MKELDKEERRLIIEAILFATCHESCLEEYEIEDMLEVARKLKGNESFNLESIYVLNRDEYEEDQGKIIEEFNIPKKDV